MGIVRSADVRRTANRIIRRWTPGPSISAGAHHRLTQRQATFEALEPRLLMAAISWDGEAGDGLWTTAANWSNNQIPNAQDDVTIDTGATNIRLTSGVQTIQSLLLRDPLSVQGGTLSVITTATLQDTLTLSGGVLSGGVYNTTAGSLTFTNNFNNRLVNVSIVGDASAAGGAVRVGGTLDVSGTFNIGNGQLGIEGNGALGSGLYTLAGGSLGIYGTGGAQTATLEPGVTVSGHGNVGIYVGVGGTDGNLVNQGTIRAGTAGQTLTINPQKSFANIGTVQAGDDNNATLTINSAWSGPNGRFSVQQGTLNLGGSFTTADLNLNALQRTGGVINITGALDNTDSTLGLDVTTGPFRLSGGSVTGGTIATASSSDFTFTNNFNNRLVNVSIVGAASAAGGAVRVGGTLDVVGTFIVGNGQLGIEANGSLASGLYTLAGGSVGIYGTGGTQTVTLGANATVHGHGSVGAYVGVGGSDGNLVNQGTIRADTADQTLTINPQNAFTNQGTVQAGDNNNATLTINSAWSGPSGNFSVQQGTLNLGGSFTTAGINLPDFQRNGGAVHITGSLDNSLAILAISDSTGDFRLNGGTISNGTVTIAGNAQLTFSNNFNNRLIGVGIVGNASADGGAVRVGGTLDVVGTFNVGNGQLGIEGNGSLASGLYTLAGGSIGIYGTGGTQTVTIEPSATVSGHGSVGIYVGVGGTDGNLVNQGTVHASTAGQTLTINPQKSFANIGTVQAGDNNNAILTINTPWSGPNGRFSVQQGTLNLGGSFTTADLNLNALQRTDGTINITGALDNTDTIIGLDATTGPFRLSGGSITAGTIATTSSSDLTFTNNFNNRLVNVTFDGDVSAAGGAVRVGGTLNVIGTFSVGNGQLGIEGNGSLASGLYTLAGGSVGIYGTGGTQTVTLGANATLSGHGSVGPYVGVGGSDGNLVVDGTIISDQTSFTLSLGPQNTLTVNGSLQTLNNGLFTIQRQLNLGGGGDLRIADGATVTFNNSFASNSTQAGTFKFDGTAAMGSGGTESSPRTLEAAGRDLGPVPAGLLDNFSLGRLLVQGGGYVRLLDNADNAAGTEAEAVYVDQLTVSANATLDLNGLNLYAQSATLNGTVVNGSVTLVTDQPSVTLSVSPGSILEAGGVATFTATLSATSTEAVSILLNFAGSATRDTDYNASAAQIVIPAGQLSGSITVSALTDTEPDGNETVIVSIVEVSNAVEATPQERTVTIVEPTGGELPDLTVAFQTPLPSMVTVGQSVSFDLLVRNIAATPATIPAGAVVQIYLSADGVIDGSDTLLTSAPLSAGTLAAQGQRQIKGKFNIPADATTGDRQFLAVVDRAGQVQEASEVNNVAAQAVEVGLLFGEFGGSTAPTLQIDRNGVVTTLRLTGGGSGELTPGDGFFDLMLTNTTARSALTITTRGGGIFTVRNLTVGAVPQAQTVATSAARQQSVAPADEASATLAKLVAKTTRLIGTLDAGSGLKGLELNAAEGAVIHIGAPANPADTLTLKLVQARNLTVNSAMGIKSLQASQWIDDDSSADVITAPWIGAIKITGNRGAGIAGDFQADLDLGGPGPGGVGLGAVTIAGALSGVDWNVTGQGKGLRAASVGDADLSFTAALGAVNVGSWQAGSLEADSLKSLVVRGSMAADLTLTSNAGRTLGSAKVGNVTGGAWNVQGQVASLTATSIAAAWQGVFQTLSKLTVKGDFSGSLQARTLASLSVQGDLDGAELRLLQDVDPANAKLVSGGKLTVRGAIVNSEIRAAGSITSVAAASLQDSLIFLGLDESEEALPDALPDFLQPLATLGSLTLSGAGTSFSESRVAAGRLGAIKLKEVQTDSAEEIGVAGGSIVSLTRLVQGRAQVERSAFTDGSFVLRVVA